tara:strand:+ start:435 stop:680 length:246 start_codon:yes stop_codon:yes gene_type:complete
MCGCSGKSVNMSSRFMFNLSNDRVTRFSSNNTNFRVAVPGRLSAVPGRLSAVPGRLSRRSNVRKPSFSNKKPLLKRFYFSY